MGPLVSKPSPAKCYTSTDCSGSVAQSADSGDSVTTFCSNAAYFSGQARGSDACVPAKLLCYASSDCSGTPTVGRDPASNSPVTEYQPGTTTNELAFARCPGGTLAYKNGGDRTCKAAHKFVVCHKDLNCKSTGSDVTYIYGQDTAKCPSTTASWNLNGSGDTCTRSALLCYPDSYCNGTPTIAKDAAGNVYTEYQPSGVSDHDAWLRCPDGTKAFSIGGAYSNICNYWSVKNGGTCYQSTDCTESGTSVRAFDVSKCPDSANSFKKDDEYQCKSANLFCYTDRYCSTKPSIGKDATGNPFEKYQPPGVTDEQAWGRCPIGTKSVRDADTGSHQCNYSPQLGTACYSDHKCGTTPTYVFDKANCPAGTAATISKENYGNCTIRKLICFSTFNCSDAGTMTSYDLYKPAGVSNEDAYNRCPAGTQAVKEAGYSSYTCSSSGVQRGVECYTDTSCQAGKMFAFSADKCPTDSTLSFKSLSDGICKATNIKCYAAPDCSGSVLATVSKAEECLAGTTASFLDTTNNQCTNRAACYKTDTCSDTPVYGTEAAASVKSCAAVTGAVAVKAAATGSACSLVAPKCFTTADCSGTSVYGTETPPANSWENQNTVTCPTGTQSFIGGGSSKCSKMATCHMTKNCSDTGIVLSTNLIKNCPSEYFTGKDTGGSCTKITGKSACFLSEDCSGPAFSIQGMSFDFNKCGKDANGNTCKSFIESTGPMTCKQPAVCFKSNTCTGDSIFSSSDGVDACGLDTYNEYLYYNNNGTCTNRVPICYSSLNCASGTEVGAGIYDIVGGSKLYNYVGGAIGTPMCKNASARAYKDPHSGTCQKLAQCCSDLQCNNVVAYAQNKDPLTCPPVVDTFQNNAYTVTAKIVAAREPGGTIKTLTPIASSSPSGTTIDASYCDFRAYSMEYNVDEYYERYNSGPANKYARVYDSSTNKFKCCKIGSDGKISATCSEPYSRLDEDVNAVVTLDEESATLEEMEIEDDDFEAAYMCDEGALESSLAVAGLAGAA